MKQYLQTQGDTDVAFEIGVDTVYVRTNFSKKTEEDGRVVYVYDEIQYTLPEWMAKQQELIKNLTDKLENQEEDLSYGMS